MSEISTGHINDDYLELYALDRLAEPKAALVEEHLLVCELCQSRVVEWDTYVGATRDALRQERA